MMPLAAQPPRGDGGVSAIAERLGSLGLSGYEMHFAENYIDDVSILPHLTDQDLEDVGIPLGYCTFLGRHKL